MNYHDEVDERDGVETDAPQRHHAEHWREDHADGGDHEQRRPDVEAEQHERHEQDGAHAGAQVDPRLRADRQVLLVEHVEDAVGEDLLPGFGPRLRMIRRRRQRVIMPRWRCS